MMPTWLLVGLGGFLGSVLRFGAGGLANRLAPESVLPLGTLMVNVIGSLLIGIVGGLAVGKGLISTEVKHLVMVGLLGGFTTFSAFSFDTLQLWHRGQWLLAGGNMLAQLAFGMLAVWGGFLISRQILAGI